MQHLAAGQGVCGALKEEIGGVAGRLVDGEG